MSSLKKGIAHPGLSLSATGAMGLMCITSNSMEGMPHLDAKGIVHAPHREDENVIGHLEAVLLQSGMLGKCGRHNLGVGVDVSDCCLIVLALHQRMKT